MRVHFYNGLELREKLKIGSNLYTGQQLRKGTQFSITFAEVPRSVTIRTALWVRGSIVHV